ncbi:MAG TPA: hypothetical protein VMU43_11930 [Candidatus Acidoferrum sp.]|nr:hypothetical protein [Candidatus Acidoferrum sp.]
MKLNFVTRVFRSLAFVVIAAALAPQFARADPSARGEFTLKSPAQWGGLYMAAGTYSYSVDYHGSYTMILVSDLSGRALGYVVPHTTASVPSLEATSIQLDSVAGKTYVSSMKVGDLGLEFSFTQPSSKTEFAFKGAPASQPATTFAAAK